MCWVCLSGAVNGSIPKDEFQIPNGLAPSRPKDLPLRESGISKVPSHPFTDSQGLWKNPIRRTDSGFRRTDSGFRSEERVPNSGERIPNSGERIPKNGFRRTHGLAPSRPKDLPDRESGNSQVPSHSLTDPQQTRSVGYPFFQRSNDISNGRRIKAR